MKQTIIFLFLTCLPAYSFGQTNSEKDLVFKVKAPDTRALIKPDVSWMYCEGVQAITIHLRPSARKISKVTFLGGEIEPLKGHPGKYKLTAGTGTEGILHVYEKTAEGEKLILRKVYSFEKVITRNRDRKKGDYHICFPNCLKHHPRTDPSQVKNKSKD